MNLLLATVGEKEDRAGLLLAEDLEDGGSPEAEEPVRASGRGDPHLTRTADSRFAVDLDQNLTLEDAQDLVGGVVTMEVSDVIGGNSLNAHDQASQPVLVPGHDAWIVAASGERHRE